MGLHSWRFLPRRAGPRLEARMFDSARMVAVGGYQISGNREGGTGFRPIARAAKRKQNELEAGKETGIVYC